MDIQNMKNHIFNIKLARLTGLYQMLDPDTIKCRGRNIYHVVMSCVLLYMCLISMILMISGVYYWTVNIPISIDYFWKSVSTFYTIYKTSIIIRHSNDIWNCLSITRLDFTTFSNRNRQVLDRWRERLSWLTTIYAIIYTMSVVSYLVFTLVFNEGKTPVKNHDGSIGYYRQNVMNFYLMVSDETYNAHYYKFYFIEALFAAFMGFFFFIFDFLLVTLCFSMCCQMRIVCSAFESVGHKSVRDPQSPIDYTNGNTKITLMNTI
ncbi:uncharacterized protein LOC107883037 [Acyrthosiphon pisum]|uniref:Odorant receptor n=1 Tax=Acyrthosiphon pisum TaxID=7029 RepID=A0A8R2NXF2_ACYPI|nr:uncharacterized protein LOC107883037 [Acyrthosiphon pisum]